MLYGTTYEQHLDNMENQPEQTYTCEVTGKKFIESQVVFINNTDQNTNGIKKFYCVSVQALQVLTLQALIEELGFLQGSEEAKELQTIYLLENI